MSFILDALRKSEHARQKTTGPGLGEVPIAAPRARTNIWAIAAVALLVINLAAVGIVLLRRAQKADAVAAATTSETTPPAPDAARSASQPPAPPTSGAVTQTGSGPPAMLQGPA